MMTDLVDQHMGDDVAKGLIVFGPVVEYRPPVEQNLVGELSGFDGETLAQSSSLEKTEEIERGFQAHVLEHIVIGKIRNEDGYVAGQRVEIRRQFGVGLYGERFELNQGRRVACSALPDRLRFVSVNIATMASKILEKSCASTQA